LCVGLGQARELDLYRLFSSFTSSSFFLSFTHNLQSRELSSFYGKCKATKARPCNKEDKKNPIMFSNFILQASFLKRLGLNAALLFDALNEASVMTACRLRKLKQY